MSFFAIFAFGVPFPVIILTASLIGYVGSAHYGDANVGFLGALHDAGPLPPLLAATLGGLLTTWVTFVPCFLRIFLGAPVIERLRDNHALTAALTAVTAAVVASF
ncbi:Chromate transporter [Loktanella fryxellensis]|uniref:Chromate transporter n=1 Tax=Loktanella fryxellensis TaxID=245187 RepID=A0A1H8JFE8_9RHOB|nr:chromate transporter [Loktanella fryxellensis]SEN78937.1 Chromate transporter [Loktanella fryxellensis]